MAVLNLPRSAGSWSLGLPTPRAPALRRLAGRAAAHLVSAFCALGAVYAVLSLALAAAAFFGFASYTVLTGSMEPNLPVGSIVVTHPVPAAQVAPGDVITFQPPGRPDLVTHRVAAVVAGSGTSYLVTRGDADAAADSWRLPLTGSYPMIVLDVPLAGKVRAALTESSGRLVLVGLGLLLFATALVSDGARPGPPAALRLVQAPAADERRAA